MYEIFISFKINLSSLLYSKDEHSNLFCLLFQYTITDLRIINLIDTLAIWNIFKRNQINTISFPIYLQQLNFHSFIQVKIHRYYPFIDVFRVFRKNSLKRQYICYFFHH